MKKNSCEKGFVLVVSLLVCAVLMLLALPFIARLQHENLSSHNASVSARALSLAEAGVERAIWEINYGDITSWAASEGDTYELEFGLDGGTVHVEVDTNSDSNVVVESRGQTSLRNYPVRRVVRVELRREKFLPWKSAAFGDDFVRFNRYVRVDSYDSKKGLYGAGNAGSDGDISTNGTVEASVELSSFVSIFGDVYCGAGANPATAITLGKDTFVSGEKAALSEPQPTFSVEPPDLPWRGSITAGSTTISESVKWDSFTAGQNSVITIEGNVVLYVTGDFQLGKYSRLVIPEGSSLTLYLGAGQFKIDQGAAINNLAKDPTKLLILGTDSFTSGVQLDQGGGFWGAIYTPQAPVTLAQNLDFYGSLFGKTVELSQNSKLHYDEALESLDLLKLGVDVDTPYKVWSWNELLGR